jgi:hypothetical protein
MRTPRVHPVLPSPAVPLDSGINVENDNGNRQRLINGPSQCTRHVIGVDYVIYDIYLRRKPRPHRLQQRPSVESNPQSWAVNSSGTSGGVKRGGKTPEKVDD